MMAKEGYHKLEGLFAVNGEEYRVNLDLEGLTLVRSECAVSDAKPSWRLLMADIVGFELHGNTILQLSQCIMSDDANP